MARPGDIGWVHGANTRASLSAALSDPRVHFIEGDISLAGTEIIVAHPPTTESDLAFEQWLDMTVATGKGAKLDFKSPDALVHCLTYAARHAVGKIPLCVNADVLPAPLRPDGTPESMQPTSASGFCLAGLDGRPKGRWLHEGDDRHHVGTSGGCGHVRDDLLPRRLSARRLAALEEDIRGNRSHLHHLGGRPTMLCSCRGYAPTRLLSAVSTTFREGPARRFTSHRCECGSA